MEDEKGGDSDIKKSISVGDAVPFNDCEIINTFYLVRLPGHEPEKYLVDREGTVYLKSRGEGAGEEIFQKGESADQPLPADIEAQPRGAEGGDQSALPVSPDSAEYQRAAMVVRKVLDSVEQRWKNEFRLAAPRLVVLFAPGQAEPLAKYLARERGGLAGLQAFLIREIFSCTTYAERGLDILPFLIRLIALNEEGVEEDKWLKRLSPPEYKLLLINFLDFFRQMGDSEAKKKIFDLVYKNFLDLDFKWLTEGGSPTEFVSSEFIKALRSQRDFLSNELNRNYLETVFQKIKKVWKFLPSQHMLSFLKALAILRLVANSTKEQRGKDEAEREALLHDIVAY